MTPTKYLYEKVWGFLYVYSEVDTLHHYCFNAKPGQTSEAAVIEYENWLDQIDRAICYSYQGYAEPTKEDHITFTGWISAE